MYSFIVLYYGRLEILKALYKDYIALLDVTSCKSVERSHTCVAYPGIFVQCFIFYSIWDFGGREYEDYTASSHCTGRRLICKICELSFILITIECLCLILTRDIPLCVNDENKTVVFKLKLISLNMFMQCSRLCHCKLKCTQVHLRFHVTGMWHCVLRLKIHGVSKEHRTFIFSVKSNFFIYLKQKFKPLRSCERSRRVVQETASYLTTPTTSATLV
jgi:hypothetical protein